MNGVSVQSQKLKISQTLNARQTHFNGSLHNSSGWLGSGWLAPSPSIEPKEEKPLIHEEFELMKVNIPPRDKSLLSLGGLMAAIAGVFYAVAPAPVPQTQPPVQTPQVQTEPVKTQKMPLKLQKVQNDEAKQEVPQSK